MRGPTSGAIQQGVPTKVLRARYLAAAAALLNWDLKRPVGRKQNSRERSVLHTSSRGCLKTHRSKGVLGVRREPCKAVEAPENFRPALRAARQAGGSVRTARSWAYVRSLDTPLQSSTPRVTQQGQTLGAPPGWEPPWLLPSPSLLDPGPPLLRLLAPPSDWVSSGGGCSAYRTDVSPGADRYQHRV